VGTIGVIDIAMRADPAPLQRDLVRGAAAVKGMGTSLMSIGGSAAGLIGVGSAAAVLTVGVHASAAAIGFAVKSASDLNEVISKSDAVLGDASESVKQFADEVATKFGLAKREILDAATSFGAIGQGLGELSGKELSEFSKKFAMLAVDLSSQANISLEESTQALQIGLTGGKSDILKRNGAVINETTTKQYALAHSIGKVGVELTLQQQLMAKSGLITEKLSKVSGDFERTLDGVANSERSLLGRIENLAAALGMVMEPITKQVLANAAAGVMGLQALIEQYQAFVIGLKIVGDVVTFKNPLHAVDAARDAMLKDLIGKGADQAIGGVAKNLKGPDKKDKGPNEDALKLQASLKEQIAVFGMTGAAVDVYKLKLNGLSDAELKDVTALAAQLDAMEKNKKVMDEFKKIADSLNDAVKTPFDTLQDHLADLQEMLNRGMIGFDAFSKGTKLAFKEFEDKSGLTATIDEVTSSALSMMNAIDSGPKHVGAMAFGSAEARTAVLANRDGVQGKDHMMEVAKNTLAQLNETRQLKNEMKIVATVLVKNSDVVMEMP
jgi:hypothetical protein